MEKTKNVNIKIKNKRYCNKWKLLIKLKEI